MNRILWLTYKNGISKDMQSSLNSMLVTVGLHPNDCYFVNLSQDTDEVTTFVTLRKYVQMYQPKFIICQDYQITRLLAKSEGVLQNKIEGFMRKYRGSIYDFEGTKVLTLALFSDLYNFTYGRWLFLTDLCKAKRWFDSKPHPEPKFRYMVVHHVENLDTIEKFLGKCMLLSIDIETGFNTITVVSFSGFFNGSVYTFVVPIVNPLKLGNKHWQSPQEEIQIWNFLKRVCSNNIPKVFQNGNFDNSHFLRHGIVVNNWLLDTYHMWHCIFQDIPKSLDFICSVVLDNYKYWKDENKGDDTEKIGKHELVGRSQEEMERYWRYGGLDSHNTLLASKQVLYMMIQLNYPIFNYSVEFNSARGPALFSTMHGFPLDVIEQSRLITALEKEAAEKLDEIHRMVGTTEFNPNSINQLSHLIYNVLGCNQEYAKRELKRGKKKKTEVLPVGKDILTRIAEEHPLYNFVISRILAYKQARNNVSKYGTLSKPYDRFYWRANAAGTETWRQSTNKHHFNTGSNAQNIPSKMRSMFYVDDGWFLFDFDFAQSDLYYIAHESEDLVMIDTVLSPDDTHIRHAELFFKIPYEEIKRGYEAGEEFYSHDVHGIRQLTKRITHGSSGGMGSYRLYLSNLGRSNTVIAAKALGHKDAGTWDMNRLVKFCDTLTSEYFIKYFRCKQWQNEAVKKLTMNKNMATLGGGMTRKFFGEIQQNSHEHRDLLMFYGQGGTSYAINRTLNQWFYGSEIDKSKCQIFLQVHDNLIGKVRYDALDQLVKLKEIMERPFVINGREFFVPADGNIGFVWKKGIKWRPDITANEIHGKAQKPNVLDIENYELHVA